MPAHRSPLPFIARTLMPREVQVNALMAVTLGALEGGLLGVIVKTGFAGVASPVVVNVAVALVTGAPAFANITSLAFANWAHGRHKTRWVASLMALCALAALLIALAPLSVGGLVWLTFWMIVARLCWCGVITLRAAIWRANFPRHVRATITGQIAVTYSIVMAATAAGIGVAMEFNDQSWRVLFPTTTLPVAILTPIWARRLDQVHILDYRARHSWSFVLAIGMFVPGAIFGQIWLFWLGALALGAAFAGGKLGWNLGHNDFASDSRSTLYMGIHVSLTGVRGLLAPLAGVGLYQWLETTAPGNGRYVLLLPFALTLAGALVFVQLARLRRRETAPRG
ncbi:MAG: hypothetical protein LC637_14075 [Xanthomonadaceae bacterium]|nr:hypothetical protein [Xanthomonadaceae bacterium]